ncbi:hypothetical protein [Nocardia sp. NBC_00416]|uniref:hypothetical protein n=1 Tax=Nocardia sp. NBC_00416 TaxID=2975991 RepID=UPI002E20FB04
MPAGVVRCVIVPVVLVLLMLVLMGLVLLRLVLMLIRARLCARRACPEAYRSQSDTADHGRLRELRLHHLAHCGIFLLCVV